MRRWVWTLGVCAVLMGALAGCDWYDGHHGECDLIVINDTACDLKVLVDGWEVGVVHSDAVRTVDDIGSGRHVLEAVDRDDHLIERRYVDLSRGEDYYWRLDSC